MRGDLLAQELVKLKKRWWAGDATNCSGAEDREKDANELSIQNVGGIFIALLAGLALAIVVAFVEFLVYARSRRLRRGAASLCALAMSEFALAAKCLRRSHTRSRGHADGIRVRGTSSAEDEADAATASHVSFRRFAEGADALVDEEDNAADEVKCDLSALDKSIEWQQQTAAAVESVASQVVYAVPPPPPPPAPEKLARLLSMLNPHPHP